MGTDHPAHPMCTALSRAVPPPYRRRRYDSVAVLGSPADAAAKILDQYLNREFMSSRIGIK